MFEPSFPQDVTKGNLSVCVCQLHHTHWPHSTAMTDLSECSNDQLRELLKRAIAGDEDSFRSVYRHLHPYVRGKACLFFSRACERDAICQEVWLKVIEHWRRDPEVPSYPRAWFQVVATNTCLDQMRRRTRRPRTVPLGDVELKSLFPVWSPGNANIEQRLREIILVKLSPKESSLVFMRYWGMLRYNEIAAATDMTADQVKYYLGRALQTLREFL